jgi:erythritol transport system ATP-binding protein
VTRALKGVNFDVRRGKVTVLFGENGAGKSTLMKIMSGVTTPTDGHLELDGERIQLSSTNEAVDLGISIIHQELNLAPNLSVRDNIFLGRELRKRSGAIDYAAERKITRELMQRLEEPIGPGTLVQDLRVGQQQIIEIARALAADTRILIMDEPTSALSASEVEVLFKVIRDLTANGVAIVYISHHLEEAIEIADYAVVFRDGDLVATEDAANIDLPWVVRQMVGREADYDFRDEPRDYGDVALSIQGVTVAEPETGRVTVNNLSLDVREGEVVCLYGLMGAGRTELMEALAGRDALSGGQVLLAGQDVANLTIEERIAAGQSEVLGEAGLRGPQARAPEGRRDGRRREGEDLESRRADHLVVRWQPAEGRDRQDAAHRPQGDPPGRADPRDRRRCQGGDLLAALPGSQARTGRPLRDLRGRRGTDRLASDRRDEQGPHRGRVRPAKLHPR